MDHSRTLSIVLQAVHSGQATTRPELVRQTDLGRSLVDQRVGDAIRVGLLEETALDATTGGRPAKMLRFCSEQGVVLAVVFGATRVAIELTDLAGRIVGQRSARWDVSAGPEETLRLLIDSAEELLAAQAKPLWAASVGLPGPVDVRTGCTVHPPIMRGWHEFPVRDYLERQFNVPVFVDNDVNLMALGAWYGNGNRDQELLLVKAGTGVGAGIITNGRLVRGGVGAAGDFGHATVAEESAVVCRCGNFGCLEALAGGWALARDAYTAAFSRSSAYLQTCIEGRGSVDPIDIARGARDGEPVCTELMARSAALLGASISTAISMLNPTVVYVGGALSEAGAGFLEGIEAQINRRTQPLASASVRLEIVDLQHREGSIGAFHLTIDSLLAPSTLGRWWANGNPSGVSAADPEGTLIAVPSRNA